MKSTSAIGKEWAKSILEQGYTRDNRNTDVTYAKVWNRETGKFKTVKLTAETTLKHKIVFCREIKHEKF